jgi:uncharacterized protein YdhG (YjbR/CyaY superfamily)
MQSKAKTVAQYLKEVPAERAEALKRLRQLCIQTLKGYEECMEYGSPSYKRDGIVEVAFNSQKQYISLYVLKTAVLNNNRDRLKGLSVGKGCVRYPSASRIDFDIVRKLLIETRETKGTIC